MTATHGRGSNQYRARGHATDDVPNERRAALSAAVNSAGPLTFTTAEWQRFLNRGDTSDLVDALQRPVDVAGPFQTENLHEVLHQVIAARSDLTGPHIEAVARWLGARSHGSQFAATVMNLTAHPECPAAVQERWATDPQMHSARSGIFVNPNASPTALASVVERFGEMDQYITAVAAHPNTPADTLSLLSKKSSCRQAVAANPTTPPKVLARLSTAGDRETSSNAAANPSLPQRALAKIAGSERGELRAAVARNPVCTPAILDRLATDQDASVRAAAIAHPQCPEAARSAAAFMG